MISAYGATPHKAEVSRVLGESKGAGVRAVKNLIAKNRAVEAFGASSSFKAPAAYLADDVAARVGPLLANIHSWDFDMWAVVDAVGDQRLAAKVLADEVIVKARDLAPGPYGAVVRTCVDAIVAGYEDVAYHNCLHGADCMQSLHATLAKSPKYEAALALDRADLEASTRLPCAPIRTVWTRCASRTQHSIRPKISRIDVDAAERESLAVIARLTGRFPRRPSTTTTTTRSSSSCWPRSPTTSATWA